MNTAQAFTSEFNALAVSRAWPFFSPPRRRGARWVAYYEMDFLSAGTTSNDNQTNSYTLRQREAWAQAVTLNSGFAITGGQMWSLATEVKKGINEAPGIENLPNTIDPQYHVGFTFDASVRCPLHPGTRFKKQNIGFAVEESQTVLAAVTNPPTNFFIGSAGNTGGLYNSTGNGSARRRIIPTTSLRTLL